MNKKRAYFIQRLGAFLIDSLILGVFVTLITSPFITDKISNLSNQSLELMRSAFKSVGSTQDYISQSMNLSFEYAKSAGIITLISVVLYILYYIVVQYYFKGQTLGKRLFKIKIVKLDDSPLTLNDLVIRNMINNRMLFSIVTFIFVFTNKQVYFYGSGVVQFFETLLLIVSAFMIILRQDGRSVCDMIAKTEVISMKEE